MAARGRTPHANNLAQALNDLEDVTILLEKGHDPNIHIGSGVFLLEMACRMKSSEIVKVLLEFGADPDLSSGKDADIRPLHIAAMNDSVAIIEELIKAGAHIEATDKHGWTPLHRAVERDNLAAVKVLMDHGANADCRCMDPRIQLLSGHELMYLGQCPLMTAIEIGSLNVVGALLRSNKVNVNYVMSGTSTLVMALLRYKDEIAEKLLGAGANAQYCNSSGRTPLFYAYNPKTVDLLLNCRAHPDGCVDAGCTHQHKTTPLHHFIGPAFNVRMSSCARRLIHRGCDINRREMDRSQTPLDIALEYRQFHVARALIIYGCDVSEANVQILVRIGDSDKKVKDFCDVWVFNAPSLLHLCCVKIRKILHFDFVQKLQPLIDDLRVAKPAARNILMDDIYQEIRGPS